MWLALTSSVRHHNLVNSKGRAESLWWRPFLDCGGMISVIMGHPLVLLHLYVWSTHLHCMMFDRVTVISLPKFFAYAWLKVAFMYNDSWVQVTFWGWASQRLSVDCILAGLFISARDGHATSRFWYSVSPGSFAVQWRSQFMCTCYSIQGISLFCKQEVLYYVMLLSWLPKLTCSKSSKANEHPEIQTCATEPQSSNLYTINHKSRPNAHTKLNGSKNTHHMLHYWVW